MAPLLHQIGEGACHDAHQQAQSGVALGAGRYPLRRLGDLIEFLQYGTSEKANSEQRGIPILRIPNVKSGMLDLAELKHIPLPDREVEGLRLQDGDMLVIRTSGSRDLVGTCAVFHAVGDFVFASYLIRARFERLQADPDFVALFLNSPVGRQQVDAVSRQIMQNNINSEELRGLRIPVPPLAVQRDLVARVNAARAEAARERAAAAALRASSAAEIEGLILGRQSDTPSYTNAASSGGK